MLLVHTHLPGALQVPTNNWIRQQLFLEHDAKLKRQIRIQHGDVERRAVVHGKYVRLTYIDFFQPDNSNRRKNRLHDHLCPGASKCMKLASTFVEEAEWTEENAEKDRVGPD